jgi:hypothetical protein
MNSFYGTAEDAAKVKADLDRRVEDVNEAIKNGTLDQITTRVQSTKEDLNDGYINDGIGWERPH